MKIALTTLALAVLAAVSSHASNCSFDKCPSVDDSVYTVHLVPHTHLDVGWLKTVDQYFFGTNGGISNAAVQYIYDSVLSELLTDPNKRFMFVETGFFDLWWNHRDNATQADFKRLVANGQIEFVSGGYVMNDEAAPYYMNTIDQMSYGLGILKELFGECGVSRVGWQVDPFGHSREFASLLSQMGFKGLFFGRIDHQDQDFRQSSKNMEFTWQASESLSQAQLTGVVLANRYSPPPRICFDQGCGDDEVVEDQSSEEYNVPSRIQDLLNFVNDKSRFYATNNLLVTLGDDFQYHNAHKWLQNVDALIRQTNGKGYKVNGLPVRLVYSTPSCYLKSIQNKQKTVKSDDFFPYSTSDDTFWTGYFTSRPAFKFLDRLSNNWFQAAKQLVAMSSLGAGQLDDLRRALAIAQHHDAISGTAKQHVNNDYTKMISKGLSGAEEAVKNAIGTISTVKNSDLIICRGLNISQCDEINDQVNSEGISLVAYNPSSLDSHTYVRVPISDPSKSFAISGANGANLVYDVLPISEGVSKLAERNGKATHEVVFSVDVPALGFTNADIHLKATKAQDVASPKTVRATTTVQRGGTTLTVDPTKGVTQITTNGVTTKVSHGYYFYKSHDNNGRASGAYIFRPADQNAVAIPLTKQEIINGTTITEIRNKYSDWVYDTIKVNDKGEIEYDWVIGAIPVDDNVGKEIIWRIDTDINSGKTFYTDSNGRENLQRTLNFRPTWNLTLQEPTAGNYYPVNARIAIQDADRELGVLVDRSVGGSSLAPGRVEIMLHRRCLHDDGFGVGEPLNEPGFDGKGLQVRGSHRLVINKLGGSHRRIALQRALQPIIAFASSTISAKQTMIDSSALPSNVQLLSLEQLADRTFLIRLENIYEKKDNSNTAAVNLSKLFNGRISQITETLLAANLVRSSSRFGVAETVLLTPMQIRTFVVTLI